MISKTRSCFTIIIVLVFLPFAPVDNFPLFSMLTSATTRYVAASGSDVGTCESPEFPCRSIQYAVNQSSPGDIILVAAGTYTYNPAHDVCPNWARAVVCFIDKRLTILGGYSTNNWLKSDPSSNLTVIDGQDTYRGVVVIGYATTTTHLHMEGFVIQRGHAYPPSNFDESTGLGGGMWVLLASVTLKDITFRNNRAIGAATAFGEGGAAFGGALRIESSPSEAISYLKRVVFENNQTIGGFGPDRGGIAFGTMFIYNANMVVEDSTFINNLVQAGNSQGSGSAGGLSAAAHGGGIGIANGSLTLKRVRMMGNLAKGGNASYLGGGAYGAGVYIEGVSPKLSRLTIVDSVLENNIAEGGNGLRGGDAVGGGMFAENTIVRIERSQFISNSVIGGGSTNGTTAGIPAGGGLFIGASREGVPEAVLENLIVANNLVTHKTGSPSGGGGGGAVIQGIKARITHATIARNRLSPTLVLGQGLNIIPWDSQKADVNLKVSIVADHREGGSSAASIVVEKNSVLTFERVLFAGNLKDTNVDGSPVPPGSIINITSTITSSSAGFISPFFHNYHLRVDSPAKDQAGPILAEDIDRQPRPFGTAADLGADEYHPFLIAVSPGDRTLRLDWTNGVSVLTGGVAYYKVNVTCETGANPPNEIGCGEHLNVGMYTTMRLSGLTNFKWYTIEIRAYDANDVLLATSTRVSAFPTNLLVFLPLVLR